MREAIILLGLVVFLCVRPAFFSETPIVTVGIAADFQPNSVYDLEGGRSTTRSQVTRAEAGCRTRTECRDRVAARFGNQVRSSHVRAGCFSVNQQRA